MSKVMFCPECREAIDNFRYGSMRATSISPEESWAECCRCGCNEVFYTESCDVCGNVYDVRTGDKKELCDDCLKALAEDLERFNLFLRDQCLMGEFYLGYYYGAKDADKIPAEIVDIVRLFVIASVPEAERKADALNYLKDFTDGDADKIVEFMNKSKGVKINAA